MTIDSSFTQQTQDEIFRKLTLDTLEGLPDVLREDLRAVAVPRFFNADVLAAMQSIPIEQASTRNKELQKLSFIQPYGQEGHIIFDSVRAVILREWKKSSSLSKFIKLNKRLVNFYQEKCGSNPFHSTTEQTESIYHQLVVYEREGFAWFEKEFLRSLEFSLFDHCSFLIRTLMDRNDNLSITNKLWLEFYSGLLAERRAKWKDAEEKYRHLELQEGLPTELRAFLVNRLVTISQKSLGIIQPKRQDENNVPLDISSEISLLEDFYRQRQSEAKVSFTLATLAGLIGFITIISGVVGALFSNIQIAVVTSAAGIVAEITASLLFIQNNKSRNSMDECQKDLVKMRNLSKALNVVTNSIATPAEREKRVAYIVDELIGIKAS